MSSHKNALYVLLVVTTLLTMITWMILYGTSVQIPLGDYNGWTVRWAYLAALWHHHPLLVSVLSFLILVDTSLIGWAGIKER